MAQKVFRSTVRTDHPRATHPTVLAAEAAGLTKVRCAHKAPKVAADYSGRALPLADASFEPPNAWGLKPKPKPDWENPYGLANPPHLKKIKTLNFEIPTPPGVDLAAFEPPNPWARKAVA